MKTKLYFLCELQTVKVDGVEHKDVQIVSSVFSSTTLIENAIELPEEYLGTGIVGTMYVPSTKKFVVVDVEELKPEPTQLDRIEDITMQSAIETAYVASLIELGL